MKIWGDILPNGFMPCKKTMLLLCIFFLGAARWTSAQNNMIDSTRSNNNSPAAKIDSIKAADTPQVKVRKQRVYHPDSTHSPKKAVFRSAVVPGWGQLYNKRWWKVPFIYGGLTGLGLAIEFNSRYYKKYLSLAQRKQRGEILESPFNNPNYTTETFTTVKNQYKRNRDLSIIGVGALWTIQVVEAYIDAKFQHSYSMDDNLSFRVRPSVMPPPTYAFTPQPNIMAGVSVVISIK